MILTLKFVGRETERGQDQIALVEPARRQIAQHGAHKLVFELRAAQLAQHDVALLNAARLRGYPYHILPTKHQTEGRYAVHRRPFHAIRL